MRGERESRRAGELGSEGGSMDCDSCPRNGRLRYERAEPRLGKRLWSRRATALGRELKRSARRRSPGSMNSRPNPIRWTTSIGVSRPLEAAILIPSTDRSATHSSYSRTSHQHMTPPAFPFRHIAPQPRHVLLPHFQPCGSSGNEDRKVGVFGTGQAYSSALTRGGLMCWGSG